MTPAEILDLADRFFAAIPAGDIDTIRSLYAPAAEIWHNNDGLTQNVDQNLAVLSWVSRKVGNLRYEDIRREVFADGWVQQHVLRGTAPNGTAVEVPACIVFRVADGRIVRLDEYLDSGHVAALSAR